MSPPHHATVLERCHHPLVRDLAWLLFVPDLIALPWPGRPTRQALGLAGGARLSRWLDDLEAAPETLETWVGDALNGRMGLYHERLWQFLLANAPATELLAHNLRIHRDKLTLGELDLLYRQRQRRRRHPPRPTHLEVAIKFYLGLPEGPGDDTAQARWIGPGGADSLASKREHLHRHQLRLTEQPETRDAIRQLLTLDAVGADRTHPQDPPQEPPERLECRVAMPGVLFYPWRRALPPPREATADHLRGDWLAWRDWPAYRSGLPAATRGARLHKPHWLALPRGEALAPLAELERQLDDALRRSDAPLQIALRVGDGWRRLFLVADDWPRQIPLPPLSHKRVA